MKMDAFFFEYCDDFRVANCALYLKVYSSSVHSNVSTAWLLHSSAKEAMLMINFDKSLKTSFVSCMRVKQRAQKCRL